MRLVTFNVLDLFDPQGEAEEQILAAKLENLGGLLREANGDVLALQELGSEAVLQRLLGEQLSDFGYKHITLGEPDPRGIRIGIISRLPVISARTIERTQVAFPRLVRSDPEPFSGGIPLRRGLVHVTVDAGELGVVDVITLHFKSKLGSPMKDEDGNKLVDDSARGKGEAALRAFVLRSAEALFLRETIDQLLSGGAQNVVALGDYNDDADSLSVRVVSGAFYGVDPAQTLTNFSLLAEETQRFSVLHGGKPGLIDHVLGSPALAKRWKHTRILNDSLRDHGAFDPTSGLAPDSDHAPVVVTFGPLP